MRVPLSVPLYLYGILGEYIIEFFTEYFSNLIPFLPSLVKLFFANSSIKKRVGMICIAPWYQQHKLTFCLMCPGITFLYYVIVSIFFFASLLNNFALQAPPFGQLWVQEFGVPIFGSLSVNPPSGNGTCFVCHIKFISSLLYFCPCLDIQQNELIKIQFYGRSSVRLFGKD